MTTRSVIHRCDNRTQPETEEDIEKFTGQEAIWAEAVVIQITPLCDSLAVNETGCDNSGKWRMTSNCKADKGFIIHRHGEVEDYLLEIKTCPENSSIMTFKAYHLKQYCKQNARMVVPQRAGYYLFHKPVMEMMYTKLPHRIYTNFSTTDLAVQLNNAEVAALVRRNKIIYRPWLRKAREHVEANWEILKERRDERHEPS